MLFKAAVTKPRKGKNEKVVKVYDAFPARSPEQARDIVVADLGKQGKDVTKLVVDVKPF